MAGVASIKTWEQAAEFMRERLPLGVDVYLSARANLRRDGHGLTSTSSYELLCYEEALRVNDERYRIVATTPRELAQRYVSEFLPAVARVFAPPPTQTRRPIEGQRVLRLATTARATS